MGNAADGGTFDYVLVGAGLQNALIALALLARTPPARVAVVERATGVGGNHLWCFSGLDLPAAAAGFVAPIVARRFPAYDVVFPGLRRTVPAGYAAVPSARVDAVVRARLAGAPGSTLLLGAQATAVTAGEVALADGRTLRGRVVVDARGPLPVEPGGRAGYQTFYGQELTGAHGVERPVLMDATVPQENGYRFLYLVPLGPDRLLVEDTRFGDAPAVDPNGARTLIAARAASLGLAGAPVVREEQGVLPMPWAGQGPRPGPAGPLVAGYRGRWFHPGTGYSFPLAARLAVLVAATPPERLFGPPLQALAADVRRRAAFARALNRLLFRRFAPEDRWRVLARFYRLPEPVITRFYALRTTPADAARILLGRPPRGFRAWAHTPAVPGGGA